MFSASLTSRLFKAFCATALVLAAGAGFASDTPLQLAGVTTVSADQARKLRDSGVPVIDIRVANEYVDSHIKGAINVPYKEKSAKDVKFDPAQDSFDLNKLPPNKDAPLVLYCNGPECWKSYKASKAAQEAGYKKVQWLRGGLPEWKAKGYPVE